MRPLNSPANGFAMLLTSFDDANVSLTPVGLPGCTLLVDVSQGTYIGAVAFATNAVGAASLQVPLPTGLPDFDLHFQWAVANPAAAGGFVTTQGLAIEAR